MTHLTGVIMSLHRAGLTLVMIEHKLRELMKLAQRVVVLHFGEKIADGSPEEVARDPTVLQAYMGRRGMPGHA
jgi:branched-chain amino acid transport system ATP-binding protein